MARVHWQLIWQVADRHRVELARLVHRQRHRLTVRGPQGQRALV
jgi:hypothetical protein